MPTYEYECKECKTKFQIVGGFEFLFAYKPKCPTCKNINNIRRLYHPIAIIFNGDGFTKSNK